MDRPDVGFGAGQSINPDQFRITRSQWDCIVAAATNRAQEWGTSAEITVQLINYLPATYDDSAVPTPVPDLADRRPPTHEIVVTREATDVIAANNRYLDDLSAARGLDSTLYGDAATSWHRCLIGLFTHGAGGRIVVRADGDRSLTVTTASGSTYGIVFRPQPPHCTDCLVPLDDNGIPSASQPTTVDEHMHRPSYPPGAAPPGTWTTHS